jgi:uncharacterized protein (TIRG00374 family)
MTIKTTLDDAMSGKDNLHRENEFVLSRRVLAIALRTLVSLALVIYLFTLIDWNRFVSILSESNKTYLFLAPGALLIGFLFSAIRWHHLLVAVDVRQKIKDLYAYYIIGAVYNIFLPGVIGGDVARIGFCARETNSSIGLISTSVLIERFCGLIVVFVMGAIAIFCLPSKAFSALGENFIRGFLVLTTLALVLIISVLAISKRLAWNADDKTTSKLGRKIARIIKQVIHIPLYTLAKLVVFSALFLASDILATFVLAKAMRIPISLTVFFVVMPIVYVVTLLPISLGGLGVREGALVFMLTLLGVLSSDAAALAFLVYLNKVMIGLIGGLVQMVRPAKKLAPSKQAWREPLKEFISPEMKEKLP